MGAGQSTRKINVVNDEVQGVIKISDAVVERLKGEMAARERSEKEKLEGAREAAAREIAVREAATKAALEAAEKAAAEATAKAASEATAKAAAEAALAAALIKQQEEPPPPPPPVYTPPPPPPPPVQEVAPAPPPDLRPIIQYIEEPSLSALRVRQEKEEEMAGLQSHYQARLESLEQQHRQEVAFNKEAIEAAAKQVEQLFTPAPVREVCRSGRQAVQDCYTANPSKPLLCREMVLEFSKCVSEARAEILTASIG